MLTKGTNLYVYIYADNTIHLRYSIKVIRNRLISTDKFVRATRMAVPYIVKLPCGFHLINHNKFRSVSNCIREQRWPNRIIYMHIGTRRNYTRNDNTHHCKFYSNERVNRSSTHTRCADYRAVYQLASAWKLL